MNGVQDVETPDLPYRGAPRSDHHGQRSGNPVRAIVERRSGICCARGSSVGLAAVRPWSARRESGREAGMERAGGHCLLRAGALMRRYDQAARARGEGEIRGRQKAVESRLASAGGFRSSDFTGPVRADFGVEGPVASCLLTPKTTVEPLFLLGLPVSAPLRILNGIIGGILPNWSSRARRRDLARKSYCRALFGPDRRPNPCL